MRNRFLVLHALIAAAVAGAIAGTAGCLEPRSSMCDNGLLCRVGTVCHEATGTCLLEAQVEACVDVAERAPCEFAASPSGSVCRGGICVLPRCGDLIIDPGEECDDGNTSEVDDCRSDCVRTIDEDGDGVVSTLDCDDRDQDIYPGALELCDGVDNNCNGECDEGHDADGDGVTLCGTVSVLSGCIVLPFPDCRDDDPTIHSLRPEVCDGVDNDCDGQVDETGCGGSCEDGVKQFDEACDGDDFGGLTCQGFGFTDGQLMCTGSCTIDITGCNG